jgi:hypothetical protein
MHSIRIFDDSHNNNNIYTFFSFTRNISRRLVVQTRVGKQEDFFVVVVIIVVFVFLSDRCSILYV